MKTLYLLRHAKSSWDDPAIADFDRPLNNRGKNDAPAMGKEMLKRKWIPDIILTSSAKRAASTAKRIADEIKYDRKDIEQIDSIYESHYSAYVSEINNVKDKFDSILIVGHNPGISRLTYYLTGESVEFPTCALAKIEFDADSWEKISFDTGFLREFITPKSDKTL
jgi:phosphohistidine phosphatase